MAQTMMVEQGTPADGSLLAVLSPWLAVVAHQEPSLASWRLLAGVVEAFVKECEPHEDLHHAEQSLVWNQPDSVAFWLGYAVVDARAAAARWEEMQSLLQERYNQGDLSCAPLLACAAERAERATQEAAAVSMQVATFCDQYGLPLPASLER
jgi:hypothetical protein